MPFVNSIKEWEINWKLLLFKYPQLNSEDSETTEVEGKYFENSSSIEDNWKQLKL